MTPPSTEIRTSKRGRLRDSALVSRGAERTAMSVDARAFGALSTRTGRSALP